MKGAFLCLLAFTCLSVPGFSRMGEIKEPSPPVAQPGQGSISVVLETELYQVKRATAESFLRADQVDANQLLLDLEKLPHGFNSLATVTKLPALTLQSGVHGVLKQPGTVLDADAIADRDGQFVNLTVALMFADKQLVTAGFAKSGDAIFLGALDGSTADAVQLVFIRIRKI